MTNKKIIIGLCFVMILAVFATGCRPLERPAPTPTPQQQPGTPGTDTTPDTGREGDLTERANRIADEVTALEEVRSATVVITENTALVGITLSDDMEEVGTELENRIEDVVTEADREIDRVAVTADPDLFTRIENIAKETGSGRPLSGFGREVEEIIRRIIPNA